MNKAFVREEAAEDADDDSPGGVALPAGYKNYITPSGHAKLKRELEELVRRERPRIVEIVAWAASNGDRSENGDYIYGKRRLREIDRRIRFLSKRIDLAEVVDPAQRGGTDQVFFGATVQVADPEGQEWAYTIVGVDEAEAGQGRISWISPLARALIKARTGDTVRFQSPLGWRELDILEVSYRAIDE